MGLGYRVLSMSRIRDNGRENGNYYNGLHWGYIGRMEKKMETTIMGYIGIILGEWKRKLKLP